MATPPPAYHEQERIPTEADQVPFPSADTDNCEFNKFHFNW